MSEAFDFVKNYEDLFKANEVEQKRVNSLRSVKEALEKEITVFRKRINEIEQTIKDKLADSDKALKERHAHAERNFEAERQRLANLSYTLEAQRQQQDKISSNQRHRDSLQNQREIALSDREANLNIKEEKITQREKDNANLTQSNASEQMSIKKEWKAIEEAKKNNLEDKRGVDDLRIIAKNELKEAQEEKNKNISRARELDKQEEDIKEKNKLIEKALADLNKDTRILNIQQSNESKRKKDNDDKEKALKAMQTEVEFKLAQLKRLKK